MDTKLPFPIDKSFAYQPFSPFGGKGEWWATLKRTESWKGITDESSRHNNWMVPFVAGGRPEEREKTEKKGKIFPYIQITEVLWYFRRKENEEESRLQMAGQKVGKQNATRPARMDNNGQSVAAVHWIRQGHSSRETYYYNGYVLMMASKLETGEGSHRGLTLDGHRKNTYW